MRRSLTSLALVLCLAVASCKSTTAEDAQVVSAYLENAAQYYDSTHYLRAYQQWQKALELDPDEERAQLGQAMALYQLGREETKEGVERLTESERRLEALRRGGLGDQSWKAEIGYALVQQRWADLYDRALRLEAANADAGRPVNEEKRALAEKEIPRRIDLSAKSYRAVLADKRTEPNLQMSCWLGLARLALLNGEFEESLEWCAKYEKQVVRSAKFWETQGESYASKLFGARLQEAELKDVRANTLFKLNRFQEAEQELDRLLALQPERADAYLNRAMIRETRAAWDLAGADYRKYLDLTDRKEDDLVVLEAKKRCLLCEERVAAQDERIIESGPSPR
jgi:tetratricopeptide (TPR) repeat protein